MTLADHERWRHVERLLQEDKMQLYARVAGLFILLFAQPLSRICRMNPRTVHASRRRHRRRHLRHRADRNARATRPAPARPTRPQPTRPLRVGKDGSRKCQVEGVWSRRTVLCPTPWGGSRVRSALVGSAGPWRLTPLGGTLPVQIDPRCEGRCRLPSSVWRMPTAAGSEPDRWLVADVAETARQATRRCNPAQPTSDPR